MGNGREHGAGQQEHGQQEQGDSQDGGRGADHPRDEGEEGDVSSPLLNSSTTLLGQTMRNCNAIPVGVSLKLSFHVIVYKNTLHAFTLPLHCCNCYYILDPFSPLNRSISWLTCFTLK